VAWLYDPASIVPGCVGDCCNCPSVASLASVSNQSASNCEPIVPFGSQPGGFPSLFPDFDQEDGEADLTAFVELPLILGTPLRFGASLVGATGGLDFSELDGSGVTATVESLAVTAGAQVDSAAGALAAYHVNAPEPAAGAGQATAAVLLGALARRRAARR
jgi:hypothetical protein